MSKIDRPKDNSPERSDAEATAGRRIGRRVATTAMGAIAGSAIAGCGDDGASAIHGGGDGTGGAGTTGGAGPGGTTSNGVGTTSATGSPVAQTSVGAGGGEGGAGGQGTGGGGGSGGADGGGGEGQGGTPDACTGTSDLTPEELLAKIDTFVILCMENRSFDHYLGSLSLVEGRSDVSGLSGTETNPDGLGGEVPVFLLEDFTPDDPPHAWDPVHAQFNDGANDGFVTEYGGTAVMGYHVREQIPITYALADASTVCDNYFCSVLGPTWPNRFYLHGATSKGQKANSPVFGFTSIWDSLDDAGLSGTNFYHDLAWATGGYLKFSGNAGIEEFFERASLATLPNVSLIDPQFFGDGANDDHPDHHIFLGQALLASVYQALAQSTQWDRCLLIITYDEHGGFFDHVPPPVAVDEREDFAHYGFRVPTLVTGPYVRKGCAVSNVYDHASILKTIAVRFGLASLTDRMEAAEDLSACIDPNALDNPHLGVQLPMVPVIVDDLFVTPYDPSARPAHHTELWDLAESGVIPSHLDRRAEGARIARHVLEVGARLGAVKLIRRR